MNSQALAQAAAHFARHFGDQPDACAWAPGRLNLIGEHIDYNGGAVLPVPLPCGTAVALRATSADGLVGHSAAQPAARCALKNPRQQGHWLDYVVGMAEHMDAAAAPPGLEMAVVSDVPVGAGLSSSAALQIAFGRALRQLRHTGHSDAELARLAQYSEHTYVGAQVGIMDTMVSSVGQPGAALHLCCETGESQQVPLPKALQCALIDSGIGHHHAAGGYNARRAQCARAAALLGCAQLCTISAAEQHMAAQLPPPLPARVRHVVREHSRVGEAVRALQQGDVARLGQLCHASHVSLRDDFAVSLPEIDALVGAAEQHSGVHGARMVGGGFGGCVLLVCSAPHAAAAAQATVQACKDSCPRARVVYVA